MQLHSLVKPMSDLGKLKAYLTAGSSDSFIFLDVLAALSPARGLELLLQGLSLLIGPSSNACINNTYQHTHKLSIAISEDEFNK